MLASLRCDEYTEIMTPDSLCKVLLLFFFLLSFPHSANDKLLWRTVWIVTRKRIISHYSSGSCMKWPIMLYRKNQLVGHLGWFFFLFRRGKLSTELWLVCGFVKMKNEHFSHELIFEAVFVAKPSAAQNPINVWNYRISFIQSMFYVIHSNDFDDLCALKFKFSKYFLSKISRRYWNWLAD